jgi:hypothetical protein
MTAFTILVMASRTWDRRDVVEATLQILADSAFESGFDEVVVRHGACPQGGDMMADSWARRAFQSGLNVSPDRWPANWGLQGKAAGFRRNAAMVDTPPLPDVCVGFVRDLSAGATGCVELAERAGIPVQVIDYADLPEPEEVSS